MVICYAISSGVQSLCSTTITISVMLYVLIPGWVARPGELVSFTCTVIWRELLSARFTWYNSIPTCTIHGNYYCDPSVSSTTGWCCGALYTACTISPHSVDSTYWAFWSAMIIMYIVWVDVFTVTNHDIIYSLVTQDSKMELLLRSFPTLLLKVLSVWKSWSITKHTAIYSTDVFVEAPDNFIAHHW